MVFYGIICTISKNIGCVVMEEKFYNNRNMNNGGMIRFRWILAAVLLSFLIAGEASAQTACSSLANVQAWNGSIGFTYSNSGSTSVMGLTLGTIEWNFQQSADASFRLTGGGMMINNLSRYTIVQGSDTGVVNLNDMIKETTQGFGVIPTIISTMTSQGSGSPSITSSTLDVDLNTCKYKFTFYTMVNSIHTDADTSGTFISFSQEIPVGTAESGLYPIPITSTILSGSANFPVYVDIAPLTDMDQYTPGGLWADHSLDVNDPGSAAVTWEFKPAGFPGGVQTSTIAGNVTNASSGMPITGATVAAGSITATTDTHGNYAISVLPGVYTVTASAQGYRSSNAGVAVPAGATVIQNFALQPGSANYDMNGNGRIERNEAINAIVDYFNGAITKQEAVGILMAYFSGPVATPTVTPNTTVSPSATPTPSPTTTPVATITPSATSTPSPTATPASNQKILAPGGSWNLSGGDYITAAAIDARARPKQVWLVYYENGRQLDGKIMQEGETYVFSGFSVTVTSIYAGSTSDMVLLTH